MNDPGIALKVPTNAPAVRPWPIDVRVALYLVLFAITYYVGAQFGFGFRFQRSLIGVVWPASGLLVSALLLSPRKYWWVVVASAAVAHVAAVGGTMPAWRVLWQIGGTFACALATVEVLGRVGLPLHLGSRRQAVLFSLIAHLMIVSFLANKTRTDPPKPKPEASGTPSIAGEAWRIY